MYQQAVKPINNIKKIASHVSEAIASKTPTKKKDIIERIYQLVPEGSCDPQDPLVISELQSLAKALMQIYRVDKLEINPFDETCKRPLILYERELRSQLQGKVVLVTGGEGFIGSVLIEKLIGLGAARVVSTDNARLSQAGNHRLINSGGTPVMQYAVDVRDYEGMKHVFEEEKPEFVFHLAAQRLAGLAEKQIRYTVTTNVFGSQNIIHLCEQYGVKKCIYSSTGKALRYFTPDVYAGSKKLSEWQFGAAAKEGEVTYGMVRFTYVAENGLLMEELEQKIQRGVVSLHTPDRVMYAQNVTEACHLLLNALLFSEAGRLKFLTVTNLGWPIDVLEAILHKMNQTGKDLPLYFKGLPPGYEDYAFPGLYNRSGETDFNPMVNALEALSSTFDPSGQMTISDLPPFSAITLNRYLFKLHALSAEREFPEPQLKLALGEAVKEMARSVFAKASPDILLNILKWGANPKQLQLEGIDISAHRDIVELLVQCLHGKLREETLQECNLTPTSLSELLAVVSVLPSIQKEVRSLQMLAEAVAGDMRQAS